MMEKIIKEYLKVKGIDYSKLPNHFDLTLFLRRPNPDKKHLSCIRKWAEELDIPIALFVSASKYQDMEEIWKD